MIILNRNRDALCNIFMSRYALYMSQFNSTTCPAPRSRRWRAANRGPIDRHAHELRVGSYRIALNCDSRRIELVELK